MSRELLFGGSFLVVAIPLMVLIWFTLKANFRKPVNRSLALVSTSCLLWIFALFYTDYLASRTIVLWDSIAMLFGNFVSIAFMYFSRHAVYESDDSPRIFNLLFIVMILDAALLFLIPGYAGRIESSVNYHNFSGGIGYYFHLLLNFGILIYTTLYLSRKASSTRNPEVISRFGLLIKGVIVGIFLNAIAEIYFVVLDLEPESFSIIYDILCGLGVLIFASVSTYVVLRYELFDIRKAALRALIYSLSIALLAGLYSILLIFFTRSFLNLQISNKELIASVLLVVLIALTFPYIKKVYSSLTMKLFFKNYYESSSVLGELNDVFVRSPRLDNILEQSLNIICRYTSSTCAELYAVDEYKKIGRARYGKKEMISTDAATVFLSTPWTSKNILIRNVSDISIEQINFLNSIKADVMLKLETKDFAVGYLLLGPKRNGENYTAQDVSLLNIIAKNLSLAIQSAMQYKRIQQFNTTLKNEIAVATKDLVETNIKLNKLYLAKDEMISMVSHQFIPQLTATHGLIELMDKTPGDKSELIRLSRASTVRMTRLAQDMLNSTKLQAGELTLNTEFVDVVKLLQAEIDNLKFTAQKGGKIISFKHPPTLKIELDCIKFGEAFFNILDNAIKYSPKKATVEVILTESKLTISDNGIGMPEADLAKVIKKFYRSENAQNYNPSGSGIGLFVAHKIIKKHGFTFTIESKLGTGTTITIGLNNAKYLIPFCSTK
jgi:signal transduction histidine kinase